MREQASHAGVKKNYCYRTDTRTKKFRSGYCQSTGNSDFTFDPFHLFSYVVYMLESYNVNLMSKPKVTRND